MALALVTWYYLEIRIWFFTDAKANLFKKEKKTQKKKPTKQWIAILSAKTDSPVCF